MGDRITVNEFALKYDLTYAGARCLLGQIGHKLTLMQPDAILTLVADQKRESRRHDGDIVYKVPAKLQLRGKFLEDPQGFDIRFKDGSRLVNCRLRSSLVGTPLQWYVFRGLRISGADIIRWHCLVTATRSKGVTPP
jgi:hypothetical protein